MCGIGGVVLTDETLDLIGDLHVSKIAQSLALDLENRGQDATGVARVSRKGRLKVVKDPYAARRFLKKHNGVGFGAKTLLVHTRAKTQGSEYINDNNHPIVWGPVIGVHNGWINNDFELFKDFGWKRQAQVDSEALFAAIAMLGSKKALEMIEGTAAVAWIDELDEFALHVARQRMSPLNYAVSARGDFVFASTAQAVTNVLNMLPLSSQVNDEGRTVIRTHSIVAEAPEGAIYSVRADGTYVFDTFQPKEPAYTASRTMSYSMGHGWDAETYVDVVGELPLRTSLTPPEENNPSGIREGDAVWYLPVEKGYESLFGIVKHVGWRSANVKLWLDRDVTTVVPLQLDRLYLDVEETLKEEEAREDRERAIEIVHDLFEEVRELNEGNGDARLG